MHDEYNKNIPLFTRKDHFKGMITKPIANILGLSLENKKPEAIVRTYATTSVSYFLYKMEEEPLKNIRLFFDSCYNCKFRTPFNQTNKGRHLLTKEEVVLLNSTYPIPYHMDYPSMIEIVNKKLEEEIEYILHYDVSKHPLFRIKLLTNNTFNASEYLNKLRKDR